MPAIRDGETANFSLRFHLASTRKRLKTITVDNDLRKEQHENVTKTMCKCNTIVAFSLKTISRYGDFEYVITFAKYLDFAIL